LDRENVYKNCFYGSIVPRDLWRDWKVCEKEHEGTNMTNACQPELERIRIALNKRSSTLCHTLKIGEETIKNFGGSDLTLDFVNSILYASHWNNLYKDYDPRKEIFKKKDQ